MKQRYTVPTHMNLPDKILFGLTVRQVLTLLCGLSLSYQCWQALRLLDSFGLIGICVHIGVTTLPTLASMLVAFVVVRHRFLEIWALVWVRYQSLPKTYTWQHVKGTRVQGQQERALLRTASKRRQETHPRGGWN